VPIVFLLVIISIQVQAETLTLPLDQRPDWLSRDGIVMAGSWETLIFRVRRDGSEGATPTTEQRAAYRREHSPEMIAQLKDLGVNFVMMHCYKGMGLAAERQSMADAVKFANLCHEAGLRVGVYTYSGAFLWKPFFQEMPQAKDWVLLDANGQPHTYLRTPYRYYWNRNHPDAQGFFRQIIRFAVEEINTDLLHFDNYSFGAGRDECSVQRFRQYLRQHFSSAQLAEMGVADIKKAQPSMSGPPDNLLRRAWLDFSCRELAESYHDMGRYARSLRRDILLECNPGGPGNYIRPPRDHSRLLTGGEAFWDEGHASGYRDGRLATRIRTYKIARRMDNIVFAYSTTPLEMAEAMAFNLDCLGSICWFEYGKLAARPGWKELVSESLKPFVRFFHSRRDLLRNAEVVADIAVLRSFASQVFADPKHAGLTNRAEQVLIEYHTCFQIIFDQHLNDLKRYRTLILAGCVGLSDKHVQQIAQYVHSGGRLVVVGPVATYNEWMIERKNAVLVNLPQSQVINLPEKGDIAAAVRRACKDTISLSVQAAPGLCVEMTEQNQRRLIHLVNYRSDSPQETVRIRLRLPAARHVGTVQLASPEHSEVMNIPFEEQNGLVSFVVPQVITYEIAVVSIQ